MHPASFKGCKKYPLKTKSYADIVKNKNIIKVLSSTQNLNAQPNSSNAVNQSQLAPQVHDSIYQSHELGNDVTKLFQILDKIKFELRINSFSDLTNYLENLYFEITKQTEIANKTLKFMVEMSNYSKNVNVSTE